MIFWSLDQNDHYDFVIFTQYFIENIFNHFIVWCSNFFLLENETKKKIKFALMVLPGWFQFLMEGWEGVLGETSITSVEP